MSTELENKHLTSNDAKPVLCEVITAEKIILNILNMYNLKNIEDEPELKKELAKEIIKDLHDSGYI